MTFVAFIYFVLPIIVAAAAILFFVGSMFYMFSGDKKSYKDRGESFMSLAIVITVAVFVVIMLVRAI